MRCGHQGRKRSFTHVAKVNFRGDGCRSVRCHRFDLSIKVRSSISCAGFGFMSLILLGPDRLSTACAPEFCRRSSRTGHELVARQAGAVVGDDDQGRREV
jgi:hypothetical protein